LRFACLKELGSASARKLDPRNESYLNGIIHTTSEELPIKEILEVLKFPKIQLHVLAKEIHRPNKECKED